MLKLSFTKLIQELSKTTFGGQTQAVFGDPELVEHRNA